MDSLDQTTGRQLSLEFALREEPDPEKIKALLAEKIRWLLTHEFAQLVGILYRIDISETRLREVIKNHPGEDPAPWIAGLIWERQLEKARSRQVYSREKRERPPAEEEW